MGLRRFKRFGGKLKMGIGGLGNARRRLRGLLGVMGKMEDVVVMME